jgi:hypothetical protein
MTDERKLLWLAEAAAFGHQFRACGETAEAAKGTIEGGIRQFIEATPAAAYMGSIRCDITITRFRPGQCLCDGQPIFITIEGKA